jgi:integrase
MKITTQKQVEGSLPKGRHGCGSNLWLNVENETSRQWLYIYKQAGKQRSKGLGSATGTGGIRVTLVEARRLAEQCRAQLAGGRDPIAESRKAATLLGDYARRYIDGRIDEWRNVDTEGSWRRSFDIHARALAGKPIATITPAMIREVLLPYGSRHCAKQLRRRFEEVFRAARADGLRDGENPATMEALGLSKQAFKRKKVRHHPAMPYADVPGYFASLADSRKRAAAPLSLLILTAARSGEIRLAGWAEFERDKRLWSIPAHRMKANRDHVVHLSDAAIALLDGHAGAAHWPSTGRLFDISEDLMRKTLQQDHPGFTVHGFRSSYRRWAFEQTSFPTAIIKAVYSHDPAEGDGAEAAYLRHPDAMKKRRQVLEAWNRHVASGGKLLAFPEAESGIKRGMPDRRHAGPIRDRHLAKLRESGLTVGAIAERTGLSRRTVQQRLATIMKKGSAISRPGIQVR